MQAQLLRAIHQPLQFEEVADPQPQPGEVVVDIKAAALNHRDVWISKGMYPGIECPIILGSDGAGELDGAAVVIDPSFNWGDDPRAQANDYHILGLPTNGTFAEKVVVPAANVHPQPGHLTAIEAAALPLAGVTAYRAVFSRGDLQAGEKVLISGVGGGVAMMAFQFAVAAGAEVFVTSGSPEKILRAIELGAKGGANYKTDIWHKELLGQAGGFDLIVDSAAGDGFATLLKLCNPGARIVIYGGTRGKINGLSPQLLFWRQVSILGSTMGHAGEFADMLQFVSDKKIYPVVDTTFALRDANAALKRMDEGKQFGKIVLEV
jgi:zinc-binding alcohol dehydrogenase/oxidoreductase